MSDKIILLIVFLALTALTVIASIFDDGIWELTCVGAILSLFALTDRLED